MEIPSGSSELNLNIKSDSAVIYGGSFNPPHIGHIIILSYALSLSDGDFYVVTAANPPHKSLEVDFEKRFEWTKKTFSRFSNIQITDIERKLGGINYAIRTVDFFLNYYKNVTLLIGEDGLGNIEKWYKYDELLSKVTFAIYPRTRDGMLYKRGKEILGSLYDKSIIELDTPLIEISSSEIRKRVKEGKSIVGMVVDEIIEEVKRVYK